MPSLSSTWRSYLLGRGLIAHSLPVAVVALSAVVSTSGCSPDRKSPEGATKVFLRAVAANDTAKLYRMLAPDAQEQLTKQAELATAQTGGRKRFRGEDLLAARLDRPRRRLSRVSAGETQGDHASVLLTDVGGHAKETLHLVRIKGRWRVRLPKPIAAKAEDL